MKLLYRVEVHGMENYHAAGKRVVIMPNHVSFLDPPLLTAFLPDQPNFAINTIIAQQWYVRLVLGMFKVFKMDPTNPMSAKSLIEFLHKDNKVVIFPEGRITVTGSIMKVFDGPGMIAEKAEAMILPVHIQGAQYSKVSRLKGKVRQRWFPKITITILPPFKLESKQTGKSRRTDITNQLQRMLSESQFAASDNDRTVMAAVIEAATIHGRKHAVAEDIGRKSMNYGQFFTRVHALSGVLGKHIKGEYIGVLLPNSLANIVTFFTLHNLGKVPAMINFTSGAANINNACKAAEIKTILASKLFIKKAGLEELVKQITNAKIVYLEDIAKEITGPAKVKALILSYFPKQSFAHSLRHSPLSAAALLFTSGSEGAPKGVALSHRNILANISQAASMIDFSSKDIALNVLPMFHCFGLTVGTLLPIVSGVKTFLYPTPLHYNIIRSSPNIAKWRIPMISSACAMLSPGRRS